MKPVLAALAAASLVWVAHIPTAYLRPCRRAIAAPASAPRHNSSVRGAGL
jgi:hypothetical protein